MYGQSGSGRELWALRLAPLQHLALTPFQKKVSEKTSYPCASCDLG